MTRDQTNSRNDSQESAGKTRELPTGALRSPEMRNALRPSLSIVVPTYDERENIEILVGQLRRVFDENGIAGELVVVDDASPDGTGAYVEELSRDDPSIRVVRRSGKLGLSSAVMDGVAAARGDILCVMDADLSHPVVAIPAMLNAMKGDVDFVIGSRYIEGGGTEGWPFTRRFISKTACLLARPFTTVRDPMSGFFMITRHCLTGFELSSRGFKICLDLIVKADYRSVVEVPYTFVDRRYGESKLNRREILNLLLNLAGYAMNPRPRRRR